MMVKGFIFYRNGKIPFVITDNRMELFSDDDIMSEFTKEHNFKTDYTLEGECFGFTNQGQSALFFVEYSLGYTCYLRCFIIKMIGANEGYDSIGFQSPFLDDIFKYKYNYLDLVREGVNLAASSKIIYKIPFNLNSQQHEISYCIGHNNRLGLLEDFDKKGELFVSLQTSDIQELLSISVIISRLAVFMTSNADVKMKRITLYNKGLRRGWFFCPSVSEDAISVYDFRFHNFDVIRYIPKILNNIAYDAGNKITKSVPLGHIRKDDNLFSPQRFMEQVMSFEYLFDKIDHQKAQNSSYYLKMELMCMFDKFPQVLKEYSLSSDSASELIKETRRTIAHGYAYYYDFKNDRKIQRLLFIMDDLIRRMSLLWMGFTEDEITDYPII